jgi:hypothetical protein
VYKPLAQFDLDGTLADFDKSMSRELEKLRAPGEPDVSYYDESIPWVEARRDLIKAKPGFWLGLERYEPGFIIYEMVKRIGYEVRVLSRGPSKIPGAWSEKIAWCLEHLQDIHVTLTHDKGDVYGKVLVDDWPKYIDQWLAHRPRGLVIMPAHPWNEGLYLNESRVVRADGTNYAEIADRLGQQYQRSLKAKAEQDG